MDGGPPGFPQGSSCPVVLWIPARSSAFRVRGSHSLRPAFPCRSTRLLSLCAGPQPRKPESFRFGLFPFRSPLLGESRLLSLPAATEMFQFTAFARPLGRARPSAGRVAPFGHPRVKGRVRLAGAFRSLPRPSSPPGARASSVRPASLPARSRRGPSPGPAAARGFLAVALASRVSFSLSRFLPRPAPSGGPGAPSSAVKDLSGGECRIRTDGPRLAKPMLYR